MDFNGQPDIIFHERDPQEKGGKRRERERETEGERETVCREAGIKIEPLEFMPRTRKARWNECP